MQINSLNDFLKTMPKNLTDSIQKARYLYLELGKRSFYDPDYKYFMFGEEEEYCNYSAKLYDNPNIIICTTLSKQYVELLMKAGIKAELIYEDSHYSVGFYDEEGIYHLADITNDLKNIQFNCKTTYFGENTISPEKLKEIDINLGYISTKRSYSDDYWYVLRDTLQSSNLSEKGKLELVLQNMKRYGDITKPRKLRNFLYLSKIY